MEERVNKEEMERCCRLGEVGKLCSNLVYINNAYERLYVQRVDLERIYQQLRRRAQMFDIVLPE